MSKKPVFVRKFAETPEPTDRLFSSQIQTDGLKDLVTLQSYVQFLAFSVRFYEERMKAFQEWQKELPEPYRTECCNIIANGRPRWDEPRE